MYAISNLKKMSDTKMSKERLIVYQQDLRMEEECLKNIIAKLDEQIHALQVEQLNILNMINRSSYSNTTTDGDIAMKKEAPDPESQELDLTIPNFHHGEEEEEDDYF